MEQFLGTSEDLSITYTPHGYRVTLFTSERKVMSFHDSCIRDALKGLCEKLQSRYENLETMRQENAVCY